MKTKRVLSTGLLVILVLCFTAWSGPGFGAEDSHEGHDHAESESVDGHTADQGDDEDGHAGHDHGAEAESGSSGDGHEGHDHGDEEESGLKVTSETMEEFGIVVRPVGPGTIAQTIRLPGEVVFNADRLAHVTPSVAGIVREVKYSVGDRVESGNVMAVLGSRELAVARSEFLAAQARLDLARESLSRDERLLSDRIGTERQVLESRQAVREAEIALNLAEQSLHALGQTDSELKTLAAAEDTALDRYELRAPLDGVVIARELTRGEVVAEQPDEAPFVVADLSIVWVNLTVYQRDLTAVRAGQTVRIEFGHDVPDATGTVAFVSPTVDEQTRTASARVVLPNRDGAWRPGMFVRAHLATKTLDAEIVIPISAVQDVDGKTVVFVESEGAFEPRPVRLGRRTPQVAEVVSGLKSGERVVVRNGFALKAEMNRGALEHAGHAH